MLESWKYLLPSEEPFIAWKGANGKIIKLEIPNRDVCHYEHGAMFYASSAKVLNIEEIDGRSSSIMSVASYEDPNFIYTVGKTVTPKNKTDKYAGIYFFTRRENAVNYVKRSEEQ